MSRTHLREEALRQEEAARQQRLAHWQVFQPATQYCLEQVEAVGGPALAEQLAEAIRRELTQATMTADRALELITRAR